MTKYEVKVPFLGYASVLIDAETPEQAMTHALRLNTWELLKGNDNSGGIGRIDFKAAVRCGELEFVVGAKEVEEG